MLNFDYVTSFTSLPKRVESVTQLIDLFSSAEVNSLIMAIRSGKKELKKKLPAVCWQATYNGKPRKNANATPSGFFMLDVDHCEEPRKKFMRFEQYLKRYQICFVHVSPSGDGLRIVARCMDSSPLPEQQARLAKALGVEHDLACKDLARLAFVARLEDILYYDPELLSKTDDLFLPESSASQPPQPMTVAESLTPTTAMPTYKGMPLSSFVDAWLFKNGGIPAEGIRNTKFYALGRDLRYLCDFNPSAMVASMLPIQKAGLSDAELLNVFTSACQSTRRSSMPKQVEDILTEILSEYDTVDGMDEKAITKNLPPMPTAMKIAVDKFPAEIKPAVIASLLPILGTICTRYRANYIDGDEHSPSFITVVEAEQASGKSFTRKLVDIFLESLREKDKIAREEERAYTEALKASKNSKEQPVDPHAVIRIVPASISVARLLQRLEYANGQHLFSFSEEIDTLYKSNRAGAWSQKSDIYRNAFDNAEYGQDYLAENSFSTIVKVYYNMLMCGTPKAVSRFFPDSEDGLVSRVIFARLPSQFGAQIPKYGVFTEQEKKYISEMCIACESDEIKKLDLGWLNARIEKWLEAKRIESITTLNKAEDIFRRRAAVMGFRAGMIFTALSARANRKEKNDCSKFAIWVANYVLQQLLAKFEEEVNTAPIEKTVSINCANVFNNLPQEFDQFQLAKELRNHGYKQRPKSAIYFWTKAHLIKKNGKIFKKIYK